MASVIFETDLFRIQILGRTAWVEARDGQNWVLKNQHALPISTQSLEEPSPLRSAVEDFERAKHGDTSLRNALMLQKPAPRIEKPAIRPVPPPSPAKTAPRRTFRGPLRPPLIVSPAS